MNSKKGIGLTFYIFMFATFIMEFVCCFQNAKTLKELNIHYNETAIELLKPAVILDFIGTSIILILLAIGLYKVIDDEDSAGAFNCGVFSICVFAITMHLVECVTYTKAINMLGGYNNVQPADPTFVAIVIFSVLAMLCTFIATCIHFESHKTAKNIFTIFGYLSMFILVILLLINSDAGGLTLAIYIMLMLSLIVGSIFSLLPETFEIRPYHSYSSHSYSNPTYSSSTYSSSSSSTSSNKSQTSVEAAKQLRQLRELLNDGIISEEEYNEKRKKYIDLL